jgi:transcriptional regulator with XRE-family HTH domain
MSSFGKRVTELRKERLLTQKALAEELGVTKNTVSVWERDVRKPDFETLTKLCTFFNVNMSYLIGEDVARTEAPPERADDETAARWALEDLIEVSEPVIQMYMQLTDEARLMINSSIIAAYKFEKAHDYLFPMGEQVRLMMVKDEDGNIK